MKRIEDTPLSIRLGSELRDAIEDIRHELRLSSASEAARVAMWAGIRAMHKTKEKTREHTTEP